jgi:hypothetical protein
MSTGMTGIYGTGVKFWPRERDGNGTYSFLHGRERELNFRELQRLIPSLDSKNFSESESAHHLLFNIRKIELK